MKDIIVIYHAKCSDGFGAAYAAWKKFKNEAEYLAMSHGEIPPDLTGKTVYILDFSFPKDIYLDLLKKAQSVTLLDHHKTAFDNLNGCPGCHFDMTHSGAMLSWHYFHPNTPAPRFIEFIQDRDLWLFQLPETQYFYYATCNLPLDFNSWELFENENHLNSLLVQGKSIETFYQNQIRDIAQHALPFQLHGFKGLIVNAPTMFASDLGNYLAQQSGTFALIWHRAEKNIKCSLRSIAPFDCSIIAQKFGGGGHPQASAFTLSSLEELISIMKNHD